LRAHKSKKYPFLKRRDLIPTPEEWKRNYAYFIAVRSLSFIHMVKYVEEHDNVLLMLSNRYLLAKQVIPVIVPMPPTQLMSGDSNEVLFFPC
jgi:hypothetical protein